jgi:hypothetical protein
MNREELKTMFLQMDCSNVPVRKQIIVNYNNNPFWEGYGEVKILRDGPSGYCSFSSHEENPFLYVSEREEYLSGEYELIIK